MGHPHSTNLIGNLFFGNRLTAQFTNAFFVRQQWQRWQEQGLFLFFLPPYSAQMNRIEDQWHQLKAQEKAPDRCLKMNMMRAMAVIKGMETRSEAGGYSLERFKFNST